jgi:hypothetical protein
MQELPCIICGRELEPVLGAEEVINQPYGGTIFTTRGHYGSTVFDPMMEDVFLEITICDQCLYDKRHRVLQGRPPIQAQPVYKKWDADTHPQRS